jgi:hypothetical protein
MADRVKTAHERVAELKKSLPGRVDVTTDPTGASVLVDGKAQPGKTPLSLQLPAGSHQLVFSLPGYDDAQRQVDAPGGTSQSLRVTLAPARAPAPVAAVPPGPAPAAPGEPAPTEPPAGEPTEPSEPVASAPAKTARATVSSGPPAATYVLLGLAGAGAVVGGVFGVKALGDKNDFDGGAKTSDKADAAERNALIADVAFGVALTAGVTGLVLWLGGRSEPESSRVGIAPYVGPHGAGAGANVQF